MQNTPYKINDLIKEENYKAAIPLLKELCEGIDKKYENQKVFSFNHILESYYYVCFFKDDSNLTYAEHNINSYYRMLGFCNMKIGKNIDAVYAYNKALTYNPVDLDTMLQLGELYKKIGNLEMLYEVTLKAYNYCSTRATMARFYRNLGFYFLEKYEPDTALVLYQYSNIYCETTAANNELKYIASALNTPIKNYDLKYMQDVLNEKQIPLGPNPDTIGITYRVGQLELAANNIDSAKDCFTMVYDITNDDEVLEILNKLG